MVKFPTVAVVLCCTCTLGLHSVLAAREEDDDPGAAQCPDSVPECVEVAAYFSGDDKELSPDDLSDMQALVDNFNSFDDELNEVEAAALLKTVKAFDFDNSKDLDDEERAPLMRSTKYFAGDAEQFEAEQLHDMWFFFGRFGAQDGQFQGDSQLQDMMKVLSLFDGDRSNTFDDKERGYLISVTRYFAGDDEVLSDDEIADMTAIIGLFAGRDGVLQIPECASMVEILKVFDTDGNGDLDGAERKYLVATSLYFAGDDKILSASEIAEMRTVIDFFDGADDKLQKAECAAMIVTAGVFDTDDDKDLDDVERVYLVTMVQFFAGADGEMSLAELDDMRQVIDFFDGDDDKIVKRECQSMVEIVDRFDFDHDGDLDDEERRYLVTIAKYFAGADRKLDRDEINDMNMVINFFSEASASLGNDGVSIDHGNDAFTKTDCDAMLRVLDSFDINGDGHIDEVERKYLVATVKKFAIMDGDSVKLSHAEVEEMLSAIKAKLESAESKLSAEAAQDLCECTAALELPSI